MFRDREPNSKLRARDRRGAPHRLNVYRYLAEHWKPRRSYTMLEVRRLKLEYARIKVSRHEFNVV
jgi:hypothetical protein